MNVFGKKLEYNPIPKRWQVELIGEHETGKSLLSAELAAQLLNKGEICLFIDPDGRSDESVPKDAVCEFYPLSDNEEDMIDPEKIETLLTAGMDQVGSKVQMIIFDSVTNFIEPIINKIQRKQQSGELTKSAVSYKEKAQAMKTVRHIVNRYGTHTIWIYHTTDKTDATGNTKSGVTLTDREVARLGRMINLSLEVVVDKNGKRGIRVKSARRGRSGFTIWDESGTWENIRQKIEVGVWQGLSESDQDNIEQSLPETFETPADAVRWAWTYSEQHGDFFKDAAHVQNSLRSLNAQLQDSLGEDYDQSQLWPLWVEKVVDKGNVSK